MTTNSLFDSDEIPAAETSVSETPVVAAVPETPVPTQRVFRYDTHTIADPNPTLSTEDVRKALVPYFPDLVQATTTTTTEGDTQIITFAKQTTRKGAAEPTPPSVVADLAGRLLALTPIADPLRTLDLPNPLTLREIAARRDEIQAVLALRAHHAHVCERIWKRCFTLSATPLLTQLPLGF